MSQSEAAGKPGKDVPVESASAQQNEQPTSVEHADATAQAEEFLSRLTEEERMLVVLHGELYENSWQAMLNDLRNRLEGKPYIFKLASRIQDDIARIEKLQSFEREHNIKLSDLIKHP